MSFELIREIMAFQHYSKLLIGLTIGGLRNKLKTATMVMRIPEKRSTCHCYLWEQAAKSIFTRPIEGYSDAHTVSHKACFSFAYLLGLHPQKKTLIVLSFRAFIYKRHNLPPLGLKVLADTFPLEIGL